jgi:hypothetical protein
MTPAGSGDLGWWGAVLSDGIEVTLYEPEIQQDPEQE